MCVWLRLTIIKLASRKNMTSISGMISIRAFLRGIGDRTLMMWPSSKHQNCAPSMVKVIGVFTFEAVPGLKRARRKALVVALSRIGLPLLTAIVASLTLPAGSSVRTQIPLPVTWPLHAFLGYGSFGKYVALALVLPIFFSSR